MILIRRKARSTGTIVSLEDMGADYSDGRYMTVCDTHGGCVCHTTQKLAKGWLSHPEDWCPDCRGDEKQ